MFGILLNVFVIVMISPGVEMSCSLEELPPTTLYECRGQMNCLVNTDDISKIINHWSCITIRDYYSSNYGRKKSFEIAVKVRNIDLTISEDPFIGFNSISENIKNLTVEHGDLVAVPPSVYKLYKLSHFSLVYNEIENIDLNRLVSLNLLQGINVSHNAIKYNVEIDELFSLLQTQKSLVKYIDLSYNVLKKLCDNSFYNFPQLLYLDLSHNLLTKFDILTFEGITKLQTLLISENNLIELGQNFVRFVNLKKLRLDRNNLTKITEGNLKALVSLERLNLSSNMIEEIEDNSFMTLRNLEKLDLRYNRISIISKALFEHNLKMSSLLLSHNRIHHIDENSFKNHQIIDFSINNNFLTGLIKEEMFAGVSVKELNLSGGKLTQLENNAFGKLGETLTILNLSSNLISNISKTSFHSLKLLEKLDLSNNKLSQVDFDTKNLKNLTIYHLNYNSIEKINQNSFKGLSSLSKLDLSNNKIKEIESESFIDLKNLSELVLNNNNIEKPFLAGTFRKLYNLQYLRLIHTRLPLYNNESLSGMVSLKHVNLSYGELMNIEYDTFKDTGAIEVVDLSNNLLDTFNINTSDVKSLQELYLNNNQISNITAETFCNLQELKKLNLAYNNIKMFDSKGLQSVSQLNFFNISLNIGMNFDARMFDNLPFLSEVSLSNIKRPFSFNTSLNTSIISLYLSHCDVTNISFIEIYKIRNILKLDLSFNKINYLDKGSFESMPTLNWLDLSFNILTYVQPGTFLHTQMINVLDLEGNSLLALEFGALDGLSNLRVLNLSSNAFHTFSAALLHSTPDIKHLILDNNNIASINIKEFAGIGLNELGIGGNLISCDTFASLYEPRYADMVITTKRNVSHSENVHGITCRTKSKQNQSTSIESYANVTLYLSALIQRQEDLYNLIEKRINEGVPQNKDDIKNAYNNLTDSLREIFNNIQKSRANQWKQGLSDVSNSWLTYLTNTTEITTKLVYVLNNISEIVKVSKNEEFLVIKEILEEAKNINLKQMDTIQKTENVFKVTGLQKDYSTIFDMKILLYLMTVSLTGIFVILASLFAYQQIRRIGKNRLNTHQISNDCQSIANVMELN